MGCDLSVPRVFFSEVSKELHAGDLLVVDAQVAIVVCNGVTLLAWSGNGQLRKLEDVAVNSRCLVRRLHYSNEALMRDFGHSLAKRLSLLPRLQTSSSLLLALHAYAALGVIQCIKPASDYTLDDFRQHGDLERSTTTNYSFGSEIAFVVDG